MSAIPEPAQRLAPHARWAWRATWSIGCCAALVAIAMARHALPAPWESIALALALVALVVGTPLVPELRWRRWRWEVREHEIDLQRGILVVRRTLIPMARVQHVETERGVIGQALGLSTVEIHTAAGSHEIPLLRDGDAGAIRSRIAELARTDTDEIARADAGEIGDTDAVEPAATDDG
jgi:membrane protein YdbS with pleckstrin-like domain